MTDGRIEKGRATRERLIAAARELFGEQGFEATSVDAVLARAGVTKGSLYHQFANKIELFDAVLDSVIAELAMEVAAAARDETDPVEELRAGCHTWLRKALDPAIQQITIVDPPTVVGWSRYREIDEQHTLGGVRASLRRIADTGAIPHASVDLLANMVLAAVNEAALSIARADDSRQALRAGQAGVDLLLNRLTRAD